MSPRFLTSTAVLAFVLGCQSVAPKNDRPARVANNSEASRADIQTAINTAVGATVTLAGNAFTTSSVLTIENRPPQTMSNPTPQGRIMEIPPQFQLVKNGSDCILVDQRDQSRQLLSRTSCEVE